MQAKTIAIAFSLLGAATYAHADSNEDRLRDALRQSVTQMRAAQDQAAQAQSDLQKAQQDKTNLQAALDAANAKIATGAAKPGPSPDELNRTQADLAASRAQIAAMQAAMTNARQAYQTEGEKLAAEQQQRQAAQSGLKGKTNALETCKAENKHLMSTAEDILHLYETQDFRSLLVRSYEPLIGSAKVKLENLVQDYDDKIHDQEYIQPPAPVR